MFFLSLLIVFYVLGLVLMLNDIFLPGFFIAPVDFYISLTGVILSLVGIMLYVSRVSITGGGKLVDMPDPRIGKLIHMGKSTARIVNALKREPNRLYVRGLKKGLDMNIKDTGEPINIAGHDVYITSQDYGHTAPVWVVDLVDKWKKKYGCRNETEWLKLYDQLRGIRSHSDLKDIEFLKPVLADRDKHAELLSVDVDELRNMSELLYDGRVVNAKAYLDWAECATPYDNESIISSTVAHQRTQDRNLLQSPTGDVMKWVMAIVVLFIGGAIAYQVFLGGG